MYTHVVADILSFVGISAFAASGAITGIEKKVDVLGVVILATTTATGGGVLRDILLGITPPKIFIKPAYFFVAVFVALILFSFAYLHFDEYHKKVEFINRVNDYFDALGLGVFVALGTHTAINSACGHNMFLSVMIGTITGVGGGVLRDIMALKMPLILRKHVYATAALSGSFVFYFLYTISSDYSCSLIISTLITFTLRVLAIHFKWNLPKIY